MRKEDLRIVFMGTPEFAVESLRALVENGYNVVGVITMPDKPAGRGYQFQPSAVKEYALSKNFALLQPEKLRDKVFLQELSDLKADLQVVVAFRMLPEVVWAMPPKGTFNLHAALLPQYRGAAPINWAVINGEKETGVTTFFLTQGMDTGKIIFQEKTPIGEKDNAGTIHDKLMELGAALVLKTVDAIIDNAVKPISQSDFLHPAETLKPAPKLFKETCHVDWGQASETIRNFVRGLSPYPAAWTELVLPDKTRLSFKILDASIAEKPHSLLSGSIETDNKSVVNVASADGFVSLLDIQLAGKKRMKIKDFLNGFKFPDGSRFE
ncbi:MAG: methionyl-tRNA formyltransferase [Dysgonamonadaceae bacterium]|jgi:methionyl-tRNA formyltransferase|nr:methionyl-tRNA formyltransferase [Dysgonamonadaceae bacterium]